jgi:hypothetical protein
VSVSAWEEDGLDEIPCLDGLAGHGLDLAAVDAEVGKLAVREARQLVDRVTVAAPVAVVADDIHLTHSFYSRTVPMDPVLDRLTCNERNVAAGNPKVRQFAVGQAAQLGNGAPVLTPVAIVADQVHFSSLQFVQIDHSL